MTAVINNLTGRKWVLEWAIKIAKEESTCQKRKVVCCLYDKKGNLISVESNRCSPEGGTCHRLGLVQSQEGYDTESSCNWLHAEINALENIVDDKIPYKARLIGHDFFCQPCLNQLKLAGVQEFEVINTDDGRTS